MWRVCEMAELYLSRHTLRYEVGCGTGAWRAGGGRISTVFALHVQGPADLILARDKREVKSLQGVESQSTAMNEVSLCQKIANVLKCFCMQAQTPWH